MQRRWKVSILGITDSEFKFLKTIESGIFSSETNNHENKYTEYFIQIIGYNNETTIKILEMAEKEINIYTALLKINGCESNIKVGYPCEINSNNKIIGSTLIGETKNTINHQLYMDGEIVYSTSYNYLRKSNENKKILNNIKHNNTKK